MVVLGFHEFLPTAVEVASARRFVRDVLVADGRPPEVVAAEEWGADPLGRGKEVWALLRSA
jgi:hypothetical protein